MKYKEFHISDIISVSTTALLSDRHLDGYYDIVGHIVGNRNVTTVGLAISADAAREFIMTTLPWTNEVTFPPLAEDLTDHERNRIVKAFAKAAGEQYGEYHPVGQMISPPDTSPAAEGEYVDHITQRSLVH